MEYLYELLQDTVYEGLISEAIDQKIDEEDRELRESDPESYAEKKAFYG